MVGFETVATGLVKEDAAAAAGQDDGHLTRWSRPGGQLGQGSLRRSAGDVLDVEALEDLVAFRARQ